MISCILILETEDRIELTASRRHDLESFDGYVIWNRLGDVRIIYPSTIGNALSLYSSYAAMVEANRLVEIPVMARYIGWEQALPPQRFESNENAEDTDNGRNPIDNPIDLPLR